MHDALHRLDKQEAQRVFVLTWLSSLSRDEYKKMRSVCKIKKNSITVEEKWSWRLPGSGEKKLFYKTFNKLRSLLLVLPSPLSYPLPLFFKEFDLLSPFIAAGKMFCLLWIEEAQTDLSRCLPERLYSTGELWFLLWEFLQIQIKIFKYSTSSLELWAFGMTCQRPRCDLWVMRSILLITISLPLY